MHIASVHEGKKQFKCEECHVQFEVKHDLNEHIATAHEERDQFTCSFCKSNFDEIPDLNKHIASVHEGQKPFKYDKCENFTFVTFEWLLVTITASYVQFWVNPEYNPFQYYVTFSSPKM